MFTLKDLMTEGEYNKLVSNYDSYENFYYSESIYYNVSNVIASDKSTINTSNYYSEYVPFVYKNSRSEYVQMENNISLIITSLINVINTYNEALTYNINSFLTTATFVGDAIDYELKITDKLIKVTYFEAKANYTTPFKYEAIIKQLDDTEENTNITLYSTLDSFPHKKNYYFMTTYSLFQDYITKKVSSEDSSELVRIGNILTNEKNGYYDIINENVIGAYLKYNASNVYVSTDIININDIVANIYDFDIKNNDGFTSDGFTYIKYENYDRKSLNVDPRGDLEILVYNSVDDIWETIVIPNIFNVLVTPVNIITVNDNVAMTDSTVTVGEYISDDINSYKILSVVDNGDSTFDVIYDKTIISTNITIGTNYTFNPTLKPNQLTTIDTNINAEVNNVVNNLQSFIFDFELSGVEIVDLEYYTNSIDDTNVNYKVVHDSLLNYIKMEQDKVIGHVN